MDAAITDGLPRDQAQVVDVSVRNQNPRLRTLPLASDRQIDLLPGDCVESRNHQLARLVKDSRPISNSRPAYYFTLTVADGAVQRIQEDKTFNASEHNAGRLPRQGVEPGHARLLRLYEQVTGVVAAS